MHRHVQIQIFQKKKKKLVVTIETEILSFKIHTHIHNFYNKSLPVLCMSIVTDNYMSK